MASEKLSNLVDLAGAQVPTDLAYVVDISAGAAGSKRSTLNDLFAEITKNVTDLSIQFADNAATSTVSGANKGKLAYDQTAASAVGSFRVSENGAIYQNLIKGPLSGGNLTANLFPFAQNGASVGNTALAQTGSSGSRILTFIPTSPGSSLSSYSGGPLSIVNQALAGPSICTIGDTNEIRVITYGVVSTFTAPTAVANNQILGLYSVRAQFGTTVGNFNVAGGIRVRATQAWASSSGGASIAFETLINGAIPGNQIERLLINQTGCIHVAPNSGTTGLSTTGTNNVFFVGGTVAAGSRTNDNAAVAFFGTTQNGSKNVVIQQQNEQTGALLELQYQNGTVGFGFYPTASVSGIFEDWLGTSNPPAVSAAGHARLYVNTSGQFLASQNGGAYSSFFPTSGGTITGALTITASSANALAVGPNGTTNPTLNVVTNVASAATGLSIRGNAAGSGVTLTALSSGTNENVLFTPKGTGLSVFTVGGVAIRNAGSDGGFISHDNEALFLGSNINQAGTYTNAGRAAASIQIFSQSNDGNIKFYTSPTNNVTPTLRMTLNKDGDLTGLIKLQLRNDGFIEHDNESLWLGSNITQTGTINNSGRGTAVVQAFSPTAAGYITFATGAINTAPTERARIDNAGNLLLGITAAGTSAAKVLAIGGSTAPTISPADEWQAYSVDWNGGGTAAPHFRTEDGTIWRLGGTALSTSANAIANLGTAAESFIQLFLDQTLTAGGTTGNQTINKSAGSVNFAAAATTLTVTCNKCTTSSIVICTVLTNDTTATIKNVVPGAGSFVITLGAAATAETRVGFWVLNQ